MLQWQQSLHQVDALHLKLPVGFHTDEHLFCTAVGGMLPYDQYFEKYLPYTVPIITATNHVGESVRKLYSV